MCKIEIFLNQHKIWLDLITAIGATIGALVFGFWQILINRRLKNLQDYVSIAAVPDLSGKFKLLNAGKINVYLCGFDMPDKKIRLSKPRLITAGTVDSSFYWIDPPSNLSNNQEFEFKLYLEDAFGKKWITDNGGRSDEIEIEKDEKKQKALAISIWSHKTVKSNWTFKYDSTERGQVIFVK